MALETQHHGIIESGLICELSGPEMATIISERSVYRINDETEEQAWIM